MLHNVAKSYRKHGSYSSAKTKFPDFSSQSHNIPWLIYRHTFQYWKHTIICNTSINYLDMQILSSKTILYSDF